MILALSWTDKCFFLVLITGLFFVLRGMRKKQVRDAFLSIFEKPFALSAGMILLFFLTIGILDCLHFKTDSNVVSISALDKILAPMGQNLEETYSAPLALNLFTSLVTSKNGHIVQEYPRLKFISSDIQSLEQRNVFIKNTIIKSVLFALGISLLLFVFLYLGKHKFTSSQLSALITLFVLVFLSLLMYWLSRSLHVLGTGKIGQDILYYSLKSIRTGLIIGLLTTLFMLPFSIFLGITAGYFGGIVDDIIQYIYTTLSSIPGILLITASVLSMQTYITNHPEQFPTLADNADARLLALCFILGITSWSDLCRILRAETLKLREIDFVLAARALGSSSLTIIRKHLIPNVMHIVLITLVLDFSFLVLAEAVLSYIGVGVSPMTISWGNMINSARLELAREPLVWWPIFAALIFMFFLVLSSNLFSDAVRDAFDPRVK